MSGRTAVRAALERDVGVAWGRARRGHLDEPLGEAGELFLPRAPGNTGDVGPQVVRSSERPELRDALTGLSDEVWPGYNQHGATLSHYWDQLYEIFPDWQFVLDDPGDETVLAEGHTIPVAWDGTDARLGPGIDATVTATFALRAASGRPAAVSALAARSRLVTSAGGGEGTAGGGAVDDVAGSGPNISRPPSAAGLSARFWWAGPLRM